MLHKRHLVLCLTFGVHFTSLRSPTSNAHTLPRASCATQNEEIAEQLSFLYLSTFPFNKLMSMCLDTKKRALSDSFFILCCGERGIRTPGTSQFNGFQDRRNRPLCHLSFCFIKTEKNVRRMRLELTRSCDHYPLKVACIPISPPARCCIYNYFKDHSFSNESSCAQNRTRTCTSLNTRTWNERVYQFRHLGFVGMRLPH